MPLIRPLLGFAVILAVATPAIADDQPPRAYVDATIITVTGAEIERGTLVIDDGKIVAVGPSGEVAIPADAQRIDARDRVIMPGLICTHSHVGGIGGADQSGPIQPDVRIHESIDIRNPGFRRAVAGGLTTLNIMPGSGHLISGQTIYVKLLEANTIEDLLILDAAGKPMGGLKMANGTNPMGEPPFPGTRGKAAALVREAFTKAQDYRDRIARANGDPAKMPPRDIGLDALVEAMEGKRIVHHHTHRHDDIMTVLRMSEEFGFRVVLHHVSEGWKVAEEIAAAKVPCSIILVDSPGGKLEAINLVFETGGILERAGVQVAFHTDDWITDSRLFRRMAALAVRAGMSRDAALRALTIEGARMLDLGDRTGSLEPGKDADFIILDGDPLSVYAHVLETYVEGQKVFDRTDPKDHLYAVGGYGAGNPIPVYMCCQELKTGGDQ